MTMAVLCLLSFHGLVGGLDVLLNHELIERLPSRPSARTEELLHGLRELVFATLFGTFAWLNWGGALVWGVIALVGIEFLISMTDTLLEDRTRPLSPIERTLHVLLFINFGAYTALLVPVLMRWSVMPTGFTLAYHGALTWMLSFLSLASLIWSMRDLFSHFKLPRAAPAQASATGTMLQKSTSPQP